MNDTKKETETKHKSGRIKVEGYQGVFYRETSRIGKSGMEKVYYVVFKKNGKLIEEKVGRQYADDMTPAKASRIRGQLIEGNQDTRREKKEKEDTRKKALDSIWTLDRLSVSYFKSRPENKSLKTDQGRYDNYIKLLFGSKQPEEIAPLDVDRLRINLLKVKSPQTVKHVLNLLTWILNYGSKNNLCQGLPFHVKKPEVHNVKTEDLTSEQMTSLFKAIDDHSHLQAGQMMKMVLFTGLRRGEMFKLKWDDIDFNRGFITIRQPKGGKDQQIPLNPSTRELLESFPRTSPYVFPGRNGDQRKDINKQIRQIKAAAGLPATFRGLHGLRHTFASMLASSGQVDMYTLQRLMTHKDPRMTQRYAHLRDETLQKASNLAGEIIGQIEKNAPVNVVKISKHGK